MLACSAHLFISYLFLIYLFKMYLSYLFVFIDSWNSGVISAAWQGWLGLPCAFRERRWGGMLVGTRSHPIPFWEGGRENWGRGITSVPAGRTSCAWPLPAGPRSLLLPLRRCTPSHARMYLLARPPGVFSVWLTLYLMLPISGDGDKSKDVWVSLRRKDKIRYSAVVWRKSEGREDESWFCRVP